MIETAKLKYSHKVSLAKLENNQQKLDIAGQCIDASFSVRRLEEVIRFDKVLERGRAGEFSPGLVVSKYISRVSRWVKGAGVPEAFSGEAVMEDIDPKTRVKLYGKAKDSLAAIEAISGALREIVDSYHSQYEPDEGEPDLGEGSGKEEFF